MFVSMASDWQGLKLQLQKHNAVLFEPLVEIMKGRKYQRQI